MQTTSNGPESDPVRAETNSVDDTGGHSPRLVQVTALRVFRHPLLRFALLVVPLLIITFLSSLIAWIINREASLARQSLQSTNATVLLGAQQLDALFNEMQQGFAPDGRLTASDQQLLATWLRFDERFLAQDEENSAARYERALVHRRHGQSLVIKGDLEDAILHYRQAIVLFDASSEERPTVGGYIGERVDTLGHLGWALRRANYHEDADKAYQEAASLLLDERLVASPEFDPLADFDTRLMDVYIYDNRAEWAMHRGERDVALSYLERIIDVFRRLTTDFPEHTGYRASLAAAEARLRIARQQSAGP